MTAMDTPRIPVALVGAGPGDPGLISVRGRDLLCAADFVIYDYLIDNRLLELAPRNAKRLFVGKKGHTVHITQDEINEVLVSAARANPQAHIVRLKGGDPFMFGRGGEEALALHEAGIPFEVVPGITAGMAVPAYAGIPVTCRHEASSVAFVAGNEAADKDTSTIDWEHLARGVDTLCFYMGVGNLNMIASRLMEAGRPADEPVALIRQGTYAAQEMLVSTLADVARVAREAAFDAPAVIVVGAVVRLHEQLAWFGAGALNGKRIVITRPRAQAPVLADALRAEGAEPVSFPTIRITPIEDSGEVMRAIEELPFYDWAVFTSANGVSTFFDALHAQHLDARAFGTVRVAAIGSATAEALAVRGIVADLVPDGYRAERLAEAVAETGIAGKRVLIPRAQRARETLPTLLREAGARVDVVAVYQTDVDETADATWLCGQLRGRRIDAVTFTSSSSVESFWQLLVDEEGADEARALLAGVELFSIGPITSQSLRRLGLKPSGEAKVYTIDGLVAAIANVLEVQTDKKERS